MRRLKVVLVEDEEIVLKELVETIDWEGLGLEVAGTAADRLCPELPAVFSPFRPGIRRGLRPFRTSQLRAGSSEQRRV